MREFQEGRFWGFKPASLGAPACTWRCSQVDCSTNLQFAGLYSWLFCRIIRRKAPYHRCDFASPSRALIPAEAAHYMQAPTNSHASQNLRPLAHYLPVHVKAEVSSEAGLTHQDRLLEPPSRSRSEVSIRHHPHTISIDLDLTALSTLFKRHVIIQAWRRAGLSMLFFELVIK